MSHITKAASVLLVRGRREPEIFTVQRAEKLKFFGGFRAFPGGKTSSADAAIQIFAADGLHDPAGTPHERAATAARELFEETGILPARHSDGSFPTSGQLLNYLRKKLLAEEMKFTDLLRHLDVELHAADFELLGRAVTPPFSLKRFDSQFFLVQNPPNQTADIWTGELERGDWSTADDALEKWTAGEWLLSPPTYAILDAIRFRPDAEFAERLASLLGPSHDEAIPPIYFAPEVRMIPLRTQALPPSTHTNAYLVGHGPSYLIDPGPTTPEEQALLFAVLDEHKEKGHALTAIILTHHHPDHVGAAKVCSWNYEVPIWAHAETVERLDEKFQIDRWLDDGEIIELGEAPDGTPNWHLQAIHTPGHAPGHLAFYDPHYRLMFAGDMLSTLSSVVIGPPDGDLSVYLNSLRQLLTFDARLLLPAHGSPSARPKHVIEENIHHRELRESQLVRTLTETPQSVAALAKSLYKGLPQEMIRFSQLQVMAGLAKLEQEGRARSMIIDGESQWAGSVAGLNK